MFNRKDGDVLLNEKMVQNLGLKELADKMFSDGIKRDETIKNLLEHKTESKLLVYRNGNVFIEIRTKYNGTEIFVPTGLSTTKSEWWAITLSNEDGEMLISEGMTLVSVEKLKDICRNAEEYGAVRRIDKIPPFYHLVEYFLIPVQHIIPLIDAVTIDGLTYLKEKKKDKLNIKKRLEQIKNNR